MMASGCLLNEQTLESNKQIKRRRIMAFGDFQSLLPAETYYTKPGASVDVAKVEAVKRASYLSMMDQFYAQLAESERQFDITATFKEKEFGLREKEFSLAERSFGWEKKYGRSMLRLEEMGIEKQYEVGMAGVEATGEAAKYGYELGMEQLEWEREQAGDTQKFLESYFKDYGGMGTSGEVFAPEKRDYSHDWRGYPNP